MAMDTSIGGRRILVVGPRPLAIGGPHDATGFCGQRQEHGIQRISAGQGPATGELALGPEHTRHRTRPVWVSIAINGNWLCSG
jgi:hypothetical protein